MEILKDSRDQLRELQKECDSERVLTAKALILKALDEIALDGADFMGDSPGQTKMSFSDYTWKKHLRGEYEPSTPSQ